MKILVILNSFKNDNSNKQKNINRKNNNEDLILEL